MNYPSNIEQKLSVDRIREWAAGYCATDAGRQRIAAAAFSTSFEDVTEQLSLTDELRTCLMMENTFPLDGYVDASPFLHKLQIEGLYLEPAELFILKQALDTVSDILQFFRKTKTDRYPALKKRMAPIVLNPAVQQRMESTLDEHGNIRDDASPELLRIRRAIVTKQAQVSRRMQQILKTAQADGFADENATVSIRDGRAVIPLSAGNKRKIKGLVYDESASGKTVFIEPIEVIEANNEIKELGYAEQREILKILRALADFLRPCLDQLVAAADGLGEIDFIRAKAMWAIETGAVKPILTDAPQVRLLKARHPELEKTLAKEQKTIVPLDVWLNREKHILLISGPNAGGKSVCLKTVGLLQYLLQCGFLITASENSEMGIFQQLFIDVGDDQSIENDLSTYSSRLLNMNHFVRHATDQTLLLIDEMGSGTEPKAGGAIAEAVLDELVKRKSFGVITTHYTNLKYYAESTKGVINGAMKFDVQKIQPLFRLETGVPSSSYAFELAQKMELPPPIIEAAKEKAGQIYMSAEKNLRHIARNKRYWEEQNQRIRQSGERLGEITGRYQEELDDLLKQRRQIIREAKEEARLLLSETNRRIERAIREVKETKADKEHTQSVRKQLIELEQQLFSDAPDNTDTTLAQKMEKLLRYQQLRDERKKGNTGALPAPEAEERPLCVGDKVRLKGQGATGEIIKISGHTVTVGAGNILLRVPDQSLERISGNEAKKIRSARPEVAYTLRYMSQQRLDFKSVIDVRGQRTDKALDLVTQFIDRAWMLGISPVKILHGKGSGVLREEIQKTLRTVGAVAEVSDELPEFGGAGVTVVRLAF